MATYLQGVTDYIPDYQPFQPDLNFYANVLQAKQTQYDSNWKSLNNLYAELHNADLTHDQNIKKKDDLLKQIDFNIKRVTSLDLSLQQNVDQATQVFRPFYEDKYLMKDMAWTKNYNSTVSRALNLKNAQDEKMRAQYWDTGIKEMQYRKDEFKNSTLEQTLNMNNVTYTPYVNAMEKYLKLAKETGLSIDIKDVDESGLYFVREKNGKALMSPLQNLFMSAYANDPSLQAVYATQSYVKRKDYAEQYASKFNGNKAEAEKEYLREQYKFLQNYTAKKNVEAKEAVAVNQNKADDAKKNSETNQGNMFTDSYLESLEKALAIDGTVADHAEKLNNEINGGNSSTISTSARTGDPNELDLSDIELARLRVDAGTASVLAEQDILGAADIYAYRDYVYEKSANPVGLENLRHQNSLARIDYTHQLKKEEMQLKFEYDKERDRIKQGLSDGTIWYDKEGKMHEDDGSSFGITLGSPSGQFTDEINILKDNANRYNETISNYTGEFIGKTLNNLMSLSERNQISSKELWDALSWLDPNSKEAKERYGTKDGKQLLNKLFKKFENNQDKFILEFTKSNQVVKLAKAMDAWSNKNRGNSIADSYIEDGATRKKVEDYRRYRDQMTLVDKENYAKISKNIITSLDENEDFKKLKPETKQKLADLYIKKVKSGGQLDEDEFQKFVDQNLQYEIPIKKSKSGSIYDERLAYVLGSDKMTAFNNYMNKEKAKWHDKNWTKSAEGKKIIQSPSGGATAFQEYLDRKAIDYLSKNMSDADFKKLLAKKAWQRNQQVQKRNEARRPWAVQQAQSQVNQIKNELTELKRRLATDDRRVYGPNKIRLKEEIAQKEKTLKYFQNRLSVAIKQREAEEKKGLVKSPYDYTPEELAAAKKQYFRNLNQLNIAHTYLYDGEGYKKGKRVFSEQTGVDMDDLFDVMSDAYLKTINQTGPDGLKSYAGFVRTKGGRYSLGTNEVTAKTVRLNNPSYGGFTDFQEIMQDINRIRFSQDPSKYAVTYGGLTETAANEYKLDPAVTKAMLRELQLSAGKKSKVSPFMIARSTIAREKADLGAVIIIPPQEFLQKYIKDEKGKPDWAKIKMIKANGISFIAPRQQWTNKFFQENELSPLEQILNSKKSVEYKHPNGAGEYTITKAVGVPGVDYRIHYVNRVIKEDGSIEETEDFIPLQRSGNYIDESESEHYRYIGLANEHNLKMYKQFKAQGNTKVVKQIEEYFSKFNGGGFKY